VTGTTLVTGATGFLGSRLVRRIRVDGSRIVCTTRSATPPVVEGVLWRVCDLTRAEHVQALFEDERPSVVFHLASHVSGVREPDNVLPTLSGNLVAAVNVLLAAHATGGRRVVLAGSYEEPVGDDPPRSPYAAAKAGATAYARMFSSLYGLSTIVLRPSMIYGPGQRDEIKLVPYVTRCFLRDEPPVLSSGGRPIDWVYVDDVADAFATAADTPGLDGEVVEIGSGEVHTVAEIVAMLATATQATVDARFGELQERSSEQVAAADTEKARRLLGWTAVTSIEEGLARTVEDVRATLAAATST
jgi:nucleoside-diphosphate-sugar epimerase